jgi:DNA-nicking Smr family endonuclease
MNDKSTDPADDLALFRAAVGEVKPVVNDRVSANPKRPPARPRQAELDEQRVMIDAMQDDRDPDTLDSAEHLSYARNGVQRRVMRKLRNGYYAIQGELDLHGMTQKEARDAMLAFITEQNRGMPMCCVRIIHGKGRKTATEAPVLKPYVAGWLRQRREILAYSSAKPAHGGTGALYVLLRRPG